MRDMMKHRRFSKTIAATGLAAAAISLLAATTLRAEVAIQSMTINLAAGQSQLIEHLKTGSTPAIRVIENPHALVVHGETPGQLLLLGAERGQWEITVTRDDDTQVAYQINVSAIADKTAPLVPRTLPLATSDAPAP